MKPNKVSLLAGAIALTGSLCMTQAGAQVYVGSSIPTDLSASSNKLVASNSMSHMVGDGTGAQLASLILYETSGASPIKAGVEAPISLATGTDYSAGSWNSSLSTAHTYAIGVDGKSLNMASPINQPQAVDPIPEPEEWTMLLVGVGLVGYQVRRKQKLMNNSTLD